MYAEDHAFWTRFRVEKDLGGSDFEAARNA